MERKLASIQKIRELVPIEGADNIELAKINGWQVVVAKNVAHKVGDLVVYCEIDSFLPIREEFEFLRKSSYKKYGDTEGFRIKTIKLRDQISQGLILPLSILNGEDEMCVGRSYTPDGVRLQIGPYDDAFVIEEGADVTHLLNIIKYDPPLDSSLEGIAKSYFPSFLKKTNEERCQNLTDRWESFRNSNKKFYITEKLDGTSVSFYFNNGVYGVCNRNLELEDTGDFVPTEVLCDDGIVRMTTESPYWKTSKEMGVKEKLINYGKNICIQGELFGEGWKKNKYNSKLTVKFFNVFDIDKQERLPIDDALKVINELGLDFVPILDNDFILPNTVNELLLLAEGKSVLNPNIQREGFVVRSHDNKISFKAISNKFLLKSED